MKRFVVVYPGTGEITRTIKALEDQAAFQVPEGFLLLEHDTAEPWTHWFNGEEVVPGQVDLLSLDQHKAQKWEEIKKARASAELSPFIWNGHRFQTDVLRINGAVTEALVSQLQGTPWSKTWTLEDNSTLELTAAQMIQVGQLQAAHISWVHEHARNLRARIENARSTGELAAISW